MGLSKDFIASALGNQRPLLLLLGFDPLNFFIPLEERHFVPCGNHFKYADTMSGQVGSNFSYAALYVIGI